MGRHKQPPKPEGWPYPDYMGDPPPEGDPRWFTQGGKLRDPCERCGRPSQAKGLCQAHYYRLEEIPASQYEKEQTQLAVQDLKKSGLLKPLKGQIDKIPAERAAAIKALKMIKKYRAWEVLGELTQHDDANIRLKAINTLLDRTYGKAPEKVEISNPDGSLQNPLPSLTPDSLINLARALKPLKAAADRGETIEAEIVRPGGLPSGGSSDT